MTRWMGAAWELKFSPPVNPAASSDVINNQLEVKEQSLVIIQWYLSTPFSINLLFEYSRMNKAQLKYLECDKPGYHYGEALNMLCLEKTCLDKALCCGACIEQSHKNHLTKPIKLVLIEAKEHASKIQPVLINTSGIISLLEDGRKQIAAKLAVFREKVNKSIETTEKFINNWYSCIIDQVKVKTANSKEGIDQIFESVYTQHTIPSLLSSMQKVIALIPQGETGEDAIKENQLKEMISSLNQDLNKATGRITEELMTKFQSGYDSIVSLTEKDIWAKQSYKFSPKSKHNEVVIINPTTIKSGNTQTYKFAILEPEVKKFGETQKMAFRIKESTSNWLAFGVCHKKIVESKSYSFVFNSTGHGGYLISSNGGSWSHIKAQFNNAVKTFKFSKADIIIVDVNYETSKVRFRKKGSNDSYELQFTDIPGDPLHPCVLLYYPNDEVQFLADYKQ